MLKGQQASEETRRRMSVAQRGKKKHPISEETRERMRIAQGNRKPISEEARKRMSLAHVGIKLPREQVEKIANKNRGKHRSEEFKNKCSVLKIGNKYNLGTHRSEETKKKISVALTGNKKLLGLQNALGHHVSEEARKKMSEIRIGRFGGSNHPNWLGGKSFEPYTLDWTETLKRSIRERDRYTCSLCREAQGDRAFAVHHIDYNKENCDPNNLVTLCTSCHTRTSFNRDYWSNYFLLKVGDNNYVGQKD